jgi:spore germination protein YaaH
MILSRRRPLAVILAVVFSLPAAQVAATDPTPAPAAEPASPPTIHAEMAAEYEGLSPSFTVGERPRGLRSAGTDGGPATTAVAGGDGPPNGLASEVFGYLPYWALTDTLLASMDYDRVSTIAYFGVGAQSGGTLAKTGSHWSGWTSSHMTDVINRAHAEGVKVVLTVTMMAWDYNYTSMSALLNSSTRRTQLAAEIATTIEARNADGVNLDFEPMPNSLQDAYTTFVRDVRAALEPGHSLTVATTGGAASWDEGYDLPALVAPGAADALMVMGYDFNWSGSARAGGVAPLDSAYSLDIRRAMDAYLAQVPADRLIWGVPYYGRAWTTTTTAQNSRTCASAGGCTAASWAFRYTDAVTSIAKYPRRWDATGQVPWYRYTSATYDATVQGYYEDSQSLDAKYDLVNAHGMRGVGIWHLLMDAGRTELWNSLAQNFGALPFTDIGDSALWQHIVWLAEQGITNGCGDGRFCPLRDVSRGEMAGFLARALEPPTTEDDFFTDDDGTTHELNINRLAAASITYGCDASRYCPTNSVTRAQMASFIDRALDLPATGTDFFTDDDSSSHEDSINRLAAAGITTGCTGSTFCPGAFVTREQMAAFLHRALGS